MRKKIDPLMLLTMLVTSGVILSHFVIFSQADRHMLQYSKLTSKVKRVAAPNKIDTINPHWQNGRQLVQVDRSKRQIR